MDDFSEDLVDGMELILEIDCTGKIVLPGYCDSHTHLGFPAGCEYEFVNRIKGRACEKNARRERMILNSAKEMEQASEDDLFEAATVRLNEIKQMGPPRWRSRVGTG